MVMRSYRDPIARYGKNPKILSVLDGFVQAESTTKDESKYFAIGIKNSYLEIGSYFIEQLLTDENIVERIMLDGKAIYLYNKAELRKFVDLYGYPKNVRGVDCFVVNTFINDIYDIDGTQAYKYDVVLSVVISGDDAEVTALTRHNGPNLLEVFKEIYADGYEHKIIFHCDSKEIISEKEYISLKYINKLKRFNLKRPIPLSIDVANGVYKVSIPELHIEVHSVSLEHARKMVVRNLNRIILHTKRTRKTPSPYLGFPPFEIYKMVSFISRYVSTIPKYR
jgi:hypothetical protein